MSYEHFIDGHPGDGTFLCQLADGEKCWVDTDEHGDDCIISGKHEGEYADGYLIIHGYFCST